MKLRITNVDMNGLNGRVWHPEPSDVGLIVTPVAMRLIYTDASMEEPVLGDDDRLFIDALDVLDTPREGETVLWMWKAVTADRRLLELADYEVEVVI